MNFANINVKKDVHDAGLTMKQIAYRMGITPEYLCRVLKSEPLPNGFEKRIRSAIAGDLINASKHNYKRIHGAWVNGICNVCGFPTAYSYEYRFCPSCGSRMEVVTDAAETE